MITEPAIALPPPGTPIPSPLSRGAAPRHMIHRTIAMVSDDLDKFRFNRGVAHIRELTNTLETLTDPTPGTEAVLREGCEAAVQLLGPMMPHLAEELWQHLGHLRPARRSALAQSRSVAGRRGQRDGRRSR